MRNTKPTAFAVACSLLLSSCSQLYYRPRPADPPLLSRKNDLKLSAEGTVGLSLYGRGQAAWSPAEHLGLVAGVGISPEGVSTNDPDYTWERRTQWHGGIGYYRTLGGHRFFEVYGGAGLVRFGSRGTGYVRQMHLGNYFVQPTLAWRYKETELALSLRYDYLHRGLTTFDTTFERTSEHDFLRYTNYHLLQPSITFRGGKKVKFYSELSLSYVLNTGYQTLYGRTSYRADAPMPASLLQLAVGLQVDLMALLKD